MPLDITQLNPAQIGTSEIATKNDISTSLAAYNPAEVINTNTTTIDGGKITTGSITANQIATNTISTNQIALGTGLVNGYVQSSDFTTVGGAGFRLKSNATGTNDDPTIYGAYIRGGYIKGTTIDGATLIGELLNISNLKVVNSTYPANTANFHVVEVANAYTTNGSGSTYSSVITLYSASYSTGFIANRVINSNQLRIVRLSSNGYYCAAERRIDGGAWVVILNTGYAQALNYQTLKDTTPFNYTCEYRAYSQVSMSDGDANAQIEINATNFG